MAPRKKSVELKANPGCCEEASMLSHKSYIPCNRPAVAIVGWKGRSDTPIRMCAMCEDHNIKNRGGYRVNVFAGTTVTPSSPSGHNSILDDEALIAENFKLEDQIKAGQAKFNEWALPLQIRVKEIESEISRRLLERKADSTKTDAGTAYFSDIMSTKVENPEALFDFVADNWNEIGADVKLNVPIGTVRQHMDANNGNLPPGISNAFFKRLNIKRS